MRRCGKLQCFAQKKCTAVFMLKFEGLSVFFGFAIISMMRFLNSRASQNGTVDLECPKMGHSSNSVDNKAKEASVAFNNVRWDGS